MVATYNDAGDTYEDTDFLWDGLDPTLAMTVIIGTSAVAAVFPGDGRIKWNTFVATDNATSGRGLISFRIEAALSTLATVTDQAMVKIVNHALNTETHRGLIRSRKPVGRPLYDATEIIADDLGSLLDDTFIAVEVRPAETMVARITALWTYYRPNFLDNSLTDVASIGGTLEAQTFAGVTLRQAIEATISQASSSADYFVDSVGKLHVFTASGLTAPFNIDNDAPTAGEVAADQLDIEYDSNSYANQVYVQGGTPEGSGLVSDVAAIAAVNGLIRTANIQVPDCTTTSQKQAEGTAFLARVKAAIVRGTFDITGVDGWRAGQMVLITDAAKGLSAASFRIHRVTTRLARPGSTTAVFKYHVEFGAIAAASATGRIQYGGMKQHGGAGQLVYGNLGGASRTYATVDGITVSDGT